MDIGPIPQSRIFDYADRHGLGEIFVRQIMSLDRTYMAERQTAQKAG